ncbi:hypothetical protein ACIP5U_04140 [Streptomyces sp. NPDC088788]|uniref:hypothetical protein n=1 Tax=Streptomyces sp. NPDC088788 TaxID=3365898 RepID=UPI003820E8F7
MGNEPQRRVLRNTALFKVPVILLALTAAALIWSVVRANVPHSARDSWPWKLALLDVQSATTATTVTAGLIFARAQYASAVRPMIGWVGYVVEVRELSESLAWMVRLVNGAGAAAQIHDPKYRVLLRNGDPRPGVRVAASDWMTRDEAVVVLGTVGLVEGEHYALRVLGPSFPLSNSSQKNGILALFTGRAMAEIEEILIQVDATDQVGDTHRRVVHCLQAAVRVPASPSLD